MAQGWLKSVTQLSDHNPRYGHADSVHPTLTHSEDDSDTDGDISLSSTKAPSS